MPERSREWWDGLNPVPDPGGDREAAAADILPAGIVTPMLADFWENGYLRSGPVLPSSLLQPVIAIMQRLRARRIPPVYIYLYDQPWRLFELLRPLITRLLGARYGVLPNLWAWHLQQAGEQGWPPHRDCDGQTVFPVGPDRMLMSLSLWIPLTDTDTANGCMWVIPRQREAEAPLSASPLSRENLHPFATALPARAGSVLGWPQDLVHWGGGMSDKARGPRLSLSLEFQNMAFAPMAEPLLDTARPPDFDQRLSLVEAQLDKYRHMTDG